MDKLNKYSSTGGKFIHHPGVIADVLNKKKGRPVSLQIAPTSKCNLNCSFCSNANREKVESLKLKTVEHVLHILKYYYGLITVEWTGGGDPTQYEFINECIEIADRYGLKQGLITNGVDVKKTISKENLNKLYWMRISMNCLDYVDSIDIPDIKGTLGMSYVMNVNTQSDVFIKIKEYAKNHNVSYVRVVPNCQTSFEQQTINNKELPLLVASLGDPFFFQAKTFCKPDKCWWGYFKPFLLHNGYFYPCSSVVLNEGSNKTFHDKYKWAQYHKMHELFNKEMVPFNNESCDYCVFSDQNKMIDDLINPNGMESFI